MWIAPKLTDGLGNRLFQLAAALGLAEKSGKPCVFFSPRISPSVHSDCSLLLQLFPQVPVVELAQSWSSISEKPYKCWTYEEISPVKDDRTLLEGYYQSEKYFPTRGISLDFENCLGKDKADSIKAMVKDAWFCHIRLGDYLILPHHQIDLPTYLQEAFNRVENQSTVFVLSDSIDTARKIIADIKVVERLKLVFIDDMSAIESLYLMSLCSKGGICSNSTFSWWGAYLSEAKRFGNPVFIPKQWIRYNVPQEDVYSPWMTRL